MVVIRNMDKIWMLICYRYQYKETLGHLCCSRSIVCTTRCCNRCSRDPAGPGKRSNFVFWILPRLCPSKINSCYTFRLICLLFSSKLLSPFLRELCRKSRIQSSTARITALNVFFYVQPILCVQVALHYLPTNGARKALGNYLSSSLVVFHKLNIAVGWETCLQSKHNCCISYHFSYDTLAVTIRIFSYF